MHLPRLAAAALRDADADHTSASLGCKCGARRRTSVRHARTARPGDRHLADRSGALLSRGEPQRVRGRAHVLDGAAATLVYIRRRGRLACASVRRAGGGWHGAHPSRSQSRRLWRPLLPLRLRIAPECRDHRRRGRDQQCDSHRGRRRRQRPRRTLCVSLPRRGSARRSHGLVPGRRRRPSSDHRAAAHTEWRAFTDGECAGMQRRRRHGRCAAS